MQPLASNRISRFTYTAGDTTATLNSQLVLLTTNAKFNSIHSGGWLGFKPSVYDAPVSGSVVGWFEDGVREGRRRGERASERVGEWVNQ